jgi:hypothetical protein
MVPADLQLVEDDLPSISFEEHCETRSIEAVNEYKEESLQEPINRSLTRSLARNLKLAPISLGINSIEIGTQEESWVCTVKKCQGSVTISANRKIVKRVKHTCNKA